MSQDQGKKIVSTMSAFNAAFHESGELDILAYLSNKLSYRTLTQTDLDNAYAFLDRVRAATNFYVTTSLIDHNKETIKKRRIDLTHIYMAVGQYPGEENKFDRYCPSIVHSLITHDGMTIGVRRLPIEFNSQHAEFRFIQRTAKVLDYKSKEFKHVLDVALALSRINEIIPDDQAMAAIAIPYGDGLFLGHAARMAPQSFTPHTNINCRSVNAQAFPIKFKDAKPGVFDPLWEPYLNFTIRTFVSRNELSVTQRELHANYAKIFSQPDAKSHIEHLMARYYIGLPIQSPHSYGLPKLNEKIRALVASPEWIKEREIGAQHIPAHETKKVLTSEYLP